MACRLVLSGYVIAITKSVNNIIGNARKAWSVVLLEYMGVRVHTMPREDRLDGGRPQHWPQWPRGTAVRLRMWGCKLDLCALACTQKSWGKRKDGLGPRMRCITRTGQGKERWLVPEKVNYPPSLAYLKVSVAGRAIKDHFIRSSSTYWGSTVYQAFIVLFLFPLLLLISKKSTLHRTNPWEKGMFSAGGNINSWMTLEVNSPP